MKVERLGRRRTAVGGFTFKGLKTKLEQWAGPNEKVVSPPWVMVKLTWYEHGPHGYSYGFAKCMYSDTFDEQRGVAIARGRAVAAYAKRLWDTAGGTEEGT